MKAKSNEIPIIVSLPTGKRESGMLVYSENGPIAKLGNGNELTSSNETTFNIRDSANLFLPISPQESVRLKPTTQIRLGYSPNSIGTDKMYPPSTDSWISHVVETDYDALYVVQEIIGSEKKLLTIFDIGDQYPLSAYKVYPYETVILEMNRDLSVRRSLLNNQKESQDIFSPLFNNSPSWESISKLVEGVTIPNLSIKETMSETLEQLVPKSFPSDARIQIMAFLAWLSDAKIPDEDPVEFRQKFSKAPILRSLVSGHLKCILSGVKPPPYVRVMILADSGNLMLTERPPPVISEGNPWFQAQYKLYELFPDWMGKVLTTVDSLNRNGVIISKLPVTKDEALQSKDAWSTRFALASQGLMIRGHVQKDAIGLRTLVYVGAAHKWPHNHLEFSARLGFQQDKSLQIQVMAVPTSAIGRVTRLMPNIHVVDWEMNSSNLSLYKTDIGKWKINKSTLLKSMERSRSLKQLENEFGSKPTRKPRSITNKQAIALDMVSWGLYLQLTEYRTYSEYYQYSLDEMIEILNELRDSGVFKLSYISELQKLTSICISVSGASNHVCSLARSFLKHAPTADVRVSDNGSSSFIIARVPENDAFALLTKLPSVARENELDLKAYPISGYIGYRNNLYQRLLRTDGSWDDDVSGLLSQVRLQQRDDE